MTGTELYSEIIAAASKADDILSDIYENGYIPENRPELYAFCKSGMALNPAYKEYEGDIDATLEGVIVQDNLTGSDVISNLISSINEAIEMFEDYEYPTTDGEKLNIDTITQDIRTSYELAVDNEPIIGKPLQDITITTFDEEKLDTIINVLYNTTDYTKDNLSYDRPKAQIEIDIPSAAFCYNFYEVHSISDVHTEIGNFDEEEFANNLLDGHDEDEYTDEDAENDANEIKNALDSFDGAVYKAEESLEKRYVAYATDKDYSHLKAYIYSDEWSDIDSFAKEHLASNCNVEIVDNEHIVINKQYENSNTFVLRAANYETTGFNIEPLDFEIGAIVSQAEEMQASERMTVPLGDNMFITLRKDNYYHNKDAQMQEGLYDEEDFDTAFDRVGIEVTDKDKVWMADFYDTHLLDLHFTLSDLYKTNGDINKIKTTCDYSEINEEYKTEAALDKQITKSNPTQERD